MGVSVRVGMTVGVETVGVSTREGDEASMGVDEAGVADSPAIMVSLMAVTSRSPVGVLIETLVPVV